MPNPRGCGVHPSHPRGADVVDITYLQISDAVALQADCSARRLTMKQAKVATGQTIRDKAKERAAQNRDVVKPVFASPFTVPW